ncbi:MAG: hypothetical protein L0Y79_08565 [Chlorobi bacterium]|nr:hypothetical protein [Chlorobiota bacterium]MCI0714969.1 hypothetical protein [Chlorobiota bacterium]
MQNSIKYIIKTGSKRTYILHIMDAVEFQSKKYIGLFLYHDEENTENDVWKHLRHRIFFESSIEAIKGKIIEYTDGRNEKITFIEHFPLIAA